MSSLLRLSVAVYQLQSKCICPFFFSISDSGNARQGIYDTLKECAAISKSAGGIGLSIHNIRAVGSYIRGTNGTSNGIVPMLRVFNDTAR